MSWASIFYLSLFIGIIGANHRPRVIGGKNAKIQFFPYQVSLRFIGEHFCGGSIITDRHILTAAHCLQPKQFLKNFLSVHSGISNSNNTGNTYKVQAIRIHPKWEMSEEDGFPNDIAVVTLRDPIVFDKYQQKINLPKRNPHSFQKAYLTGWGRTKNEPHSSAVILQKITMQLITSDICQHLIYHKITKNQICAYKTFGTGACHGDSGGPLVSEGEVVGIVSFKDKKLCAAGVPDIYTNVYAYQDFINYAVTA